MTRREARARMVRNVDIADASRHRALPEADSKQRLFVALDLPDAVRDRLATWGEGELTDPALRPVRAESLHMTVCFLGWTPPDRVAEAAEIVNATAPRPVPMRLRLQPVAKPPRCPTLYAIEAQSAAATELSREVSSAFAEAGLAQPEKRPFWPHITVARVRSERSKRRRPRPVERVPEPLPENLGGEFGAVRLSLYRSMMRSEGSLYVPLCNLNLR